MYDPGYEGKEVIIPEPGDPRAHLTEKELKHTRALYAGEVTMVDRWFGKFMAKVEELGLLDNSVILVISDHGHPLGEHAIIRKRAEAMFPTLMNCPLYFNQIEV